MRLQQLRLESTPNAVNERVAHILRNTLPVIGLAALWMSVFNRLLYPTLHTFYHLGSQMAGFVQIVYVIAFLLAALAVLFASKNPEHTPDKHPTMLAWLGAAGSIGVLLPVPFEDGSGMAIAAVVVGALMIAPYIITHFIYWSIRSSTISVHHIGFAMALSLVCYFLVDLVLALTGAHSVLVTAMCPLVSSCAIVLATASDSALSKYGEPSAHVEAASANLAPTANALEAAAIAYQAPALASEDDLFASFSEEFELSKRESELARHAYRNHSARKISQELFIAESTVYTHLKRIYRKTGVHSKQELIDLIDARR